MIDSVHDLGQVDLGVSLGIGVETRRLNRNGDILKFV